MNYLTTVLRCPSPSFSKVLLPYVLPNYFIAASNSRGLQVRFVSDRAKGHTRLSRSPATTLSESRLSESHSPLPLPLPSPSPSPSDVDNHARMSRHDRRQLLLPPPSKIRSTETQPMISFEHLDSQDLRKLIRRAQACRDIESMVEWNSEVLSCEMEDELWQKTEPMLRHHGLTTASHNKIRVRYVEQVKKKKLEIKRKVLKDVLEDLELKNEMFEQLKQVRRLRNKLAHPILDLKDIAAVVKDWIQEVEMTRDGDDKT